MSKQHLATAGRAGGTILKGLGLFFATAAIILGSIVVGLVKALSQAKR